MFHLPYPHHHISTDLSGKETHKQVGDDMVVGWLFIEVLHPDNI